MGPLGADPELAEPMASACRVLAASEDVGAVAIEVTRQPAHEELMRLRDHAAPCYVAIAKERHWTFTVRRRSSMRRSTQTAP